MVLGGGGGGVGMIYGSCLHIKSLNLLMISIHFCLNSIEGHKQKRKAKARGRK